MQKGCLQFKRADLRFPGHKGHDRIFSQEVKAFLLSLGPFA